MPFTPQDPLISVEASSLGQIDTTSVENLFGVVRSQLNPRAITPGVHSHGSQWSLLSKTSHAMKDGKRLENLSWRLWNRETFCCSAKQPRPATPSSRRCSLAHRPKSAMATTEESVPELSSSLDSASSEELDETTAMRAAPAIPKARPELTQRMESRASSVRGEKHITPVDLEHLVKSIQHTSRALEPITIQMPSPPPPSHTEADPLASQSHPEPSDLHLHSQHTATQPPPTPSPSHDTTPQPASVPASQSTLLESSASTVHTNDDDDASQTVGSEGSSNTEISMENHSVVRGFVPGGAPSSYRSQTNLAAQPTPILKKSPPAAHQAPKKRGGAMFTIGTSSGEEESSLESHMYKSSLSESLRRPNSNISGTSSRKQTSFKDEVAIGRAAEHSPVFDESDDEDEEVSESAIEEEDDDSSEWEDSDEPSGPSSVNEKEYFQRVDSRPNLTSRRSMLTTMMHEPDRAKALQNAASRSTPALRRSRTSTPNGPSVATSPEPRAQAPTMPGQEPTRPKPIIMTTSNTQHPLSLSPRTTRRNMLSTELTESLRKNLLWERQHRSTGNLAALKRRHTSNDVKNLKQHPEPAPVLSHPDGARGFNNDYFNAGLGEYHAKGW